MTNIIKAIIVDDEESARDILANLLKRFCPQVQLLDKCADVPQAVQQIKALKPDLVFLDIEMPNYAGYELPGFFDTIDFEIIFATAYEKYALKAFELAAVDYLLKPIEINRLKEAVEKVAAKVHQKNLQENYMALMDSMKTQEIKKIAVPSHDGQKLLDLTEIVAIEAQEAYSCLHTTDSQRFVVSKNLKQFESLLSEVKFFIRTHKSWIININHIDGLNKTDMDIVMKTGILAKLSRYKKEEFERLINV